MAQLSSAARPDRFLVTGAACGIGRRLEVRGLSLAAADDPQLKEDTTGVRDRWIAAAAIALLVLLPVLGGRVYGPGWDHPATISGHSEGEADDDAIDPKAPAPMPPTSPSAQDDQLPHADTDTPWSFSTAGEVWAQPVAWRDLVLVGSDDGTVYSLNAGTGRPAWSLDSGGAVRSRVTILNEQAFWTSADGFVYAAQAITGELHWRARVAAMSGAAVGRGRVVVGTEDGLVGLVADSGRIAWRSDVGPVVSTPTLAGSLVVAGTRDGHIVGVDAHSGAKRWTFDAGAEISTSPTHAGRFALVTAGDGTVYCLDASSGLERWRSGTSEFVGSAPAAANGRVFVGGGDGALWAFDIHSGLGLWRRRLAEPVRGTPVAAGDALWVAAGERFLAAVRASDGEPLHVFAVDGWVSSSPLVTAGDDDTDDAKRLVFATADGSVHGVPLRLVTEELALQPSTGPDAERTPRIVIEPTFHDGNPEILWRRSLPGRPAAPPVVHAGRVVVGAGREMRALDAESGELLWQARADGAFDAASAIVDTRVLAPRRAGPGGKGALHAFDLVDGREIWRVDVPDDLTSTPAIWRGRAIFGATDASVRAVAVGDGKALWRRPTGGAMIGSPAVAGGHGFGIVLAAGCDGVVYGLSADDGRELWRFQAEDCVASDIVLRQSSGQEVAYVADAGGHVYALDPAVGGELWRASIGGAAGRRPLSLGGTLYLGAHDRNLWALSALHGGTTWRFDAGERVTGTVVVDLGIAYAASLDGALHALGAINGQEFWRLETGAPAYDVAFADGVVYLVAAAQAGEGGVIYALRVP